MLKKSLICGIGALLVSAGISNAQVTFSGPVTDIDGRTGPQYTGPGSSDVRLRFKPMSAAPANLVVNNVEIHDVLNQKGIDIGANVGNGYAWSFDSITVNNYDNTREIRTIGGLHIDGIRISGAGNASAKKTNVTLNDISIHDGSALPVNIQDGNYGTIILNDVSVYGNQLNQVQLAAINSGHIDHVIIENSPGLHVALMGKIGSIGDVIVRNSPGASVSDVIVYGQRSGAKIVTDNSASGTVTPPVSSTPTGPVVTKPTTPVVTKPTGPVVTKPTGTTTGTGSTGTTTGSTGTTAGGSSGTGSAGAVGSANGSGSNASSGTTGGVVLTPPPGGLLGESGGLLSGVSLTGSSVDSSELEGLHVLGAGAVSAITGGSNGANGGSGSSVGAAAASGLANSTSVSSSQNALPEPSGLGVLAIAGVVSLRRRRRAA